MKHLILFVALCILAVLSLAGIVALTSDESLRSTLAAAHPLQVVSLLALSLACWGILFSLVTRDYSWVDRLWSTAPIGFAWVYAAYGEFAPTVTVLAVMATLWGARLTFNFARRGGYTGMEDYRWAILRQRIKHPALWQLFNVLFIHGFQIGLFILFTLPLSLIYDQGVALSSPLVLLTVILMLAFLIYETVADQQQWLFHKTKTAIKAGRAPADAPFQADVEQGFLSSGLFRYSRHPNYFGELGFWWTLFFGSALATTGLLTPVALGPLVLTALFIGSVRFTESISASKYPAYTAYKRARFGVVPWLPRRAEKPTELPV